MVNQYVIRSICNNWFILMCTPMFCHGLIMGSSEQNKYCLCSWHRRLFVFGRAAVLLCLVFAKSKTRQRYTVTRVPSIMDQTKLKTKASFKAYCLHELQCFFFLHSGSPCDINHKPIHGIMNAKCGLWIFGTPRYQSTSFVKNEKWPGPKRCWTNRAFPSRRAQGCRCCRCDAVVTL